jgi:Xaa-Pro aminopeptidase
MSMYEQSRLYQAALESQRRAVAAVGDGYRSSEEADVLARLDAEVSAAYADLFETWAMTA